MRASAAAPPFPLADMSFTIMDSLSTDSMCKLVTVYLFRERYEFNVKFNHFTLFLALLYVLLSNLIICGNNNIQHVFQMIFLVHENHVAYPHKRTA